MTFILEGSLTHSDSGGHESVIHAGGVQWMTAGRGLVHAELSSEEFMRRGGPLEILQLWVNLPARLKMTTPRYVGLQREGIPALPTADGKGVVNLISGTWGGRSGPIPSLTGVLMSTVALAAGGSVTFPDAGSRNVFLYVVGGRIRVGDTEADPFVLVEMDREGDSVRIEAVADAMLLFGHAEALGEPVVSHGPFVMNTEREIRQAIADYNAGKFGPL